MKKRDYVKELLEKRQENGLDRQKISKRVDRKVRKKTETKRGIEKRKFIAQNFQRRGCYSY